MGPLWMQISRPAMNGLRVMDGWLVRKLPVEWYSTGPYFPTLAAAPDHLFRVPTFTILT